MTVFGALVVLSSGVRFGLGIEAVHAIGPLHRDDPALDRLQK
jgi:hypothetical protein